MPETLRRPRRKSLISPLIDVVLGAFLALFVLFSVFVLLTRGGAPEALRFLSQVELPPAVAGQSYIFTFPVTGGTGERRFELTGELPEGLSFDVASGTIYGFVQPSAELRDRQASFSIAVRDGTGRDERAAQLDVFSGAVPYEDDGLRLLSPANPLPPGRVGRAYSVAFGALGGVEPYHWSFAGLPRGLRVEDGLLAGVPGDPGAFRLGASVEHSPGRFRYRNRSYTWSGGSTEGEFFLRIHGPLRLVERFPPGRVGEPYLGGLLTGRLLADEVVEWTDLPPGLEVDAGGLLLSGIPSEAGSFSLGYRVRTHRNRELAAGEGEIVVLPPAEPELGPAAFQVWLGEPTRQQLPVRGLVEPVHLSVEGDLPPGLEIRDRYLTGTAEQAGLSTVRLTAVDETGTTVTGEITIRVGPRF